MKTNVIKYLERTAEKFPDRIAVSQKDREISFSRLRAGAVNLSKKITNVIPDKVGPVAVYLPKSIEAVVAFAGILYSGNFYVPLDTKSPAARTRLILENLLPSSVITTSDLIEKVVQAGWPVEKVILIDNLSWHEYVVGITEAGAHAKLIDTDPVYVIYTSGSTGTPKGVTISHRGVIDYIEWAAATYPVSEADVIGSQAPFFFDNSTLDIYLCFSCGITLDLIPEELFAFPVRLAEYLETRRITMIFWVPSVLNLMAKSDALRNRPLPLLNKILFAGEVMPARTLNYWRRCHPDALYSNLYGPTEITVDCTYYIVEREISDEEPVPIGFPCRNTDVLVLNDDDRLAREDEIGELCVRGSSLALGYWNSPEKTASAFVQNPMRPQYPERIYRTGDLVQRNRYGELIFLGRKDSQIKHHGYRIELGDIEIAAGGICGLRSVCVLYNHANGEITLFYEADEEVLARELRAQLGQRLPRYMVPAAYRWLPALPLNANGKIDRMALTKEYL